MNYTAILAVNIVKFQMKKNCNLFLIFAPKIDCGDVSERILKGSKSTYNLCLEQRQEKFNVYPC